MTPLIMQFGEVAGVASAATAEFFMNKVRALNAQVEDLQWQLRRSMEVRTSFAADIQAQLAGAAERNRQHTEQFGRLVAKNEERQREHVALIATNERLRADARVVKKLADMDRTVAALQQEIAKFAKLAQRNERLFQLGKAVNEFRNLVVRDLRGKIPQLYRSWPALAQLLEEERYEQTDEGQGILKALRAAYTVYITESEWQHLSSLQRDHNSVAHPGFDLEQSEELLEQLEDENQKRAVTKVIEVLKTRRHPPSRA